MSKELPRISYEEFKKKFSEELKEWHTNYKDETLTFEEFSEKLYKTVFT